MIIGVQYQVDKDIYDRPDTPHNVVMVTSEYSSHRAEILVHLQLGKNFHIRLNNMVRYRFSADVAVDDEQFFSTSPRKKDKIKALTRSAFEEKMSRLDMGKVSLECEIVEEYHYTDKRNQPRVIQIPITVKDDSAFTVIEFESKEQHDNFIEPAWLVWTPEDTLISSRAAGRPF